MEPRRKPSDEVEAPTPRQQDWDALRGARILPDGEDEESLPDTGVEKEGDLPDEDDDVHAVTSWTKDQLKAMPEHRD